MNSLGEGAGQCKSGALEIKDQGPMGSPPNAFGLGVKADPPLVPAADQRRAWQERKTT